MKQAVKRLALSGYSKISPTHMVLEMKSLLSNKPVLPLDGTSKWEDPAWIGRQLRIHNLIEINSPLTRQFLFGKYLRIYPLKEEYLTSIISSNSTASSKTSRQPVDFCAGCETCSYRNYDCPMMKSRLASKNQRVK